jgi:hypothetical protein
VIVFRYTKKKEGKPATERDFPFEDLHDFFMNVRAHESNAKNILYRQYHLPESNTPIVTIIQVKIEKLVIT